MTDRIKLEKLQLMRSISNTYFFEAYKKLIIGDYQQLTEDEKFLLLKLAVVFINEWEKELEKFGYRIILMYSNYFDDYMPLYDIALEKDYIPIAKFIEEKHFNSEFFEKSFHRLFVSAYKENFKQEKGSDSIYFSIGQRRIHLFSKNEDNFVIVAPTSYGKSELILYKVEDNLDKNICIIVPTKSLLAQTRKNLIKNSKIRESKKRIITHPDMLNNIFGNFIAVLTQERLLRLLQKHPNLQFDIVLIDEAHNLIENDNREILTIQDLKILKKRNTNTKFYFFTPFLANPENMKIFSKDDNLLTDRVEEFVKVERYYTFDLNGEKAFKVYDQFLNKFFDIGSQLEINSEFEFINSHAASKNIVYINRPKFIEEFATTISNKIESNDEIKKVQKALKNFLHQDYNLIQTLENGVVYHHGGMPENVRLYVENAFSEIANIKYIVTTSTLLQGVNIPAEKMFLLDIKKGRGNLNAAQFKNLSGRVCRFSEVFNRNTGNLSLLEPKIYLIKGNYSDNRTNIEQFLIDRVKDNKAIPDDIENPLIKKNIMDLNEEEFARVKEAEEYQENIEAGTSELENIRIVKAEIAKACFKNNVHDFNIFENEKQLEDNYNNFKSMAPAANADALILLIENIFLWKIKLNENDTDNFNRLENSEAKKFYSMFIERRASGKSYKEMINNFVWYWKNKKTDSYIYVGKSWGEEVSPYKWGFINLYIDLSKKTNSEMTNIAIIRIKEEQDFVDYKLMPYIEILNDLNLVESNFYDKIKYGTDDPEMIKMLKEGFSIELAQIVKEKYIWKITFENEILKVKSDIVEEMRKNEENEILIFEIQYYINE